jgi:AcrR family transcriptional regulator
MVSYDCTMPLMPADAKTLPKKAAITEVMLRIVAERGLDHVSVREVAAGAAVSIGTVQHYFATKDEMLEAAYAEVISRIAARLDAVPLGDDVRRNVSTLLVELLPLDRRRVTETRVHLAFAARAATMPALAGTQRQALTRLHAGLAAAFGRATGAPPQRCRVAAHAAIAVADGLALHAASAGRWLSRPAQRDALDLTLDGIFGLLSAGQDGSAA